MPETPRWTRSRNFSDCSLGHRIAVAAILAAALLIPTAAVAVAARFNARHGRAAIIANLSPKAREAYTAPAP